MDDFFAGFDVCDENTEQRVRHFQDESWEPQMLTPAWFLPFSDDTNNTLQSEKLGPTFLVHSIEYTYFKREYKISLDLCNEFISTSKTLKITHHLDIPKLKDVYEIKGRCLLKIPEVCDSDIIEILSILNQTSEHIGLSLLKAQLNLKIHNYQDAIDSIKFYLKARKNDFNCWKLIGEMFRKMQSSTKEEDANLKAISFLFLDKSINVYKNSSKKLVPVPEVLKRHNDVYIDKMEEDFKSFGDFSSASLGVVRSDDFDFGQFGFSNENSEWLKSNLNGGKDDFADDDKEDVSSIQA